MIDDIFQSYLLNKNEKMFCNALSQTLSNFCGNNMTIKVGIVNESGISKESFFGMRIFPAKEYIDDVLRRLTELKTPSLKEMLETWKKIDRWEMEIDSRMFDRMIINFNPSELAAMCLHEVAHCVYSTKNVEVFFRAYKECRVRMSTEDKASARILYQLYTIPLIIACGMRNWRLTGNDLREELFADKSVVKLGYGEALVSAYQKIIRAYGNSSGTTDAIKKDVPIEQSIMWCNTNIGDLVHRKNKLKDELYLTGAKTRSGYIRDSITGIMNSLYIRNKDRYTGNVVLESATTFDYDNENFAMETELIYYIKGFNKLVNMVNSTRESARNSIAQEAFGRKRSNKKIDIPSQLEVDTIFVEVDRIQNHADRRYVLDLIYNQEEKIEKFKEYFQFDEELGKRYSGKMESMLKELEQMRQAVLAKRNFDKQYKVFVKYPTGYEG